jgi:hypothetical protein
LNFPWTTSRLSLKQARWLLWYMADGSFRTRKPGGRTRDSAEEGDDFK